MVSDENKGEIDCSVLPTPYEVIKLATTAGLEQVIRKHGREMMRKFEDGGSHWHLNSRGYYVNILAPNFLAVFTDRLYFEGSVVKSKEGNYLPH